MWCPGNPAQVGPRGQRVRIGSAPSRLHVVSPQPENHGEERLDLSLLLDGK